MTPSDLTLNAQCERPQVAAEVSSQRTIEWTIKAPALARPSARAPLNVALVLDRSGSMQGEKLRYVQQAACYLLDLLDERDRVAVVAYDDQITMLARSEPLSERTRQAMKEQINRLRSGGQTDLGGGWLAGCREVAAHQLPEQINRALLLTDGLANQGITDVEELARHARELRLRGVSTSTFGVGLDFNEQLLELLAVQGGGHFYYIEQPQQIPELFRRELGELLAVVARETLLSIDLPRGLAIELLGDLPHERDGDRLRVFLGDLSAGENRVLYTRVLTPPDSPGTTLMLRGEVGYADLAGHAQRVAAELVLTYAREAEVLLAPVYQAILQRASEVELAAAAAQAVKLERAGQRQQAQAIMQQTLAATAPHMPAPAAAAYHKLADQMGEGLSEEQRKETHFAAYKTRQSRS